MASCNITAGISSIITVVVCTVCSPYYRHRKLLKFSGFTISSVLIFPDLFSLSAFTMWKLAQPTLYCRLLFSVWCSQKYGLTLVFAETLYSPGLHLPRHLFLWSAPYQCSHILTYFSFNFVILFLLF